VWFYTTGGWGRRCKQTEVPPGVNISWYRHVGSSGDISMVCPWWMPNFGTPTILRTTILRTTNLRTTNLRTTNPRRRLFSERPFSESDHSPSDQSPKTTHHRKTYCFKTFTHSPGFSLSAAPDFSPSPQATGT
jgi:hypothetical protein